MLVIWVHKFKKKLYFYLKYSLDSPQKISNKWDLRVKKKVETFTLNNMLTLCRYRIDFIV